MKQHPDHSANLVALRRIEGQVRGIQNMVVERKYCVDIIDQIDAIRGALARVADDILKRHLGQCVTDAMSSSTQGGHDKKLDEILQIVRRARKS
jgi:DNA-binding FrmR family transcriptional regulator